MTNSVARRLGIFVIVACSAGLLVGCTSHPIPSPSPTPTSAPGTDNRARPTQKPVSPATSRQTAIAAATKTISADDSAFLEIFKGTIPGDSLEGFETGKLLTQTSDFINAVGDDEGADGASGEADRWFPDPTKTVVSALTSKGKRYPYATVQMSGCFQGRWKIDYASNAPTPAPTVGDFFLDRVTVQYQPTRHVWLISEEMSLNGDQGTPVCPVRTK